MNHTLNLPHDPKIVCDQNDGHTLVAIERLEDVHNLRDRFGIQVACRFVGENDAGIVGERAQSPRAVADHPATHWGDDECIRLAPLPLVLALLAVFDLPSHLLLIGDPDQLPSVVTGNVLKDLIASRFVPVVALDMIFRQSDDSLIIENAHRINHGQMPLFTQTDKAISTPELSNHNLAHLAYLPS